MNDDARRAERPEPLPPEVKRLNDELLRVGKESGPNSPQALVCKRRLMEAIDRAARALEVPGN